VIVPMIAVGVVLFQLLDASGGFKLDSGLDQAQRTAKAVYQDDRKAAALLLQPVANSPALAMAIDKNDATEIKAQLAVLVRRLDATWIALEVDGRTLEAGTPDDAIAAAQAPLADDKGKTLGTITASSTTAAAYAANLRHLTEVHVRVERGGKVLTSTLPAAKEIDMPAKPGTDFEIGGVDYGQTSFEAAEPRTPPAFVRLFAQVPARGKGSTVLALGMIAGFLVLAFVFAVIVGRTLSSEVQRLLTAAQRLGRGDFTVAVPAEGNDEFAALGKEFNSMARQLEARLEDLRKERGRLQEAIRRVGESFAKGLDRVGVLEIVVQTAVDGVGGEAGRATMRRRADAPMEEVAHTGDPNTFFRALHAAEAAVMDAGEVAEITLGGTSALAAPLSATEGGDRVLAIVSVARGDRPFSAPERELFSYLTSQAAVSVENVDLHETVQRQAVTDELTGLFNHRRFQEVMDAEVERALRYEDEMGLIMLDIDNFKRVNDTYGHMQGDEVLRAVARVLRQSAREIDEPARYGGEEMAVALPQTDLDGAYRFAERVRKRIEALELPLLEGDGILRVTASFGAASLNSAPQGDKEGLVAAADAALYRAKRSGKNRTVKAE
jgi:diguanylate cyclase (GGDEF)-like protein